MLPLNGGAIGIFDPALALAVDNSNTAGLTLRPAFWDRLRQPGIRPLPWKEVRRALLDQSRRLAVPAQLEALHGEMREHILAQENARVDLARLAARAAVHPLVSRIVGGLDRREFDRLAAVQDSRLERQLEAAMHPESSGRRLSYQWLELRSSRLTARVLRRRRRRGASAEEDYTGALLGLGDRLGPSRANYLVQSLLIAASSAPAALAACLVHSLATRPDWRAAIRDELAPLPAGAIYQEGTRRSLAVTGAFIKEALRLWTFPLISGRVATRQHDVGGYSIKEGDAYALSAYVMHRCPHHWENPETFDPQRWSAPRRPEDRAAFVPFGIGGRTCVAATLGEAQLFLLCALFAEEFEVSHDDGDAPIDIQGLAYPRTFTGIVRRRVR